MDSLSANSTLPSQSDADPGRNICDGQKSTSGLPATSSDQSPTVIDRSDGGPVTRNAPSETNVLTRSAAPCSSKGPLTRKGAECTTDPTVCQGHFEFWVNQFLSIPVNEYLTIDEHVLEKIDQSYQDCVKNPKVKDNVRAAMKIKHLLNRLLRNWQLKQDKEQTRKKLLSLHVYARGTLNVVHYVQNWVLMKCYRDILYGREVDKELRRCFVTIMNESLYSGPVATMKSSSLPYADIMSLGCLYFTGALPGFEEDANYERCFKVLMLHFTIESKHYLFFSPISFTALDYMRFCPGDLTSKLSDQKKMLPESQGINIMMVFIAFYMGKQDNQFLLWLGQEKFNVSVYKFLRTIISDFDKIVRTTSLGGKALRTLPPIKKRLFFMMSRCEKLTSGTRDDCSGLFNYFRARLIFIDKELLPRRRHAKIASLFAKSAERSPNHWSSAYNHYRKAHTWNAAANAAEHYVNYWQEKDPTTAEYWSDKFSRELQADRASQHNQPSGKAGQQVDIDTILSEFGIEPSQPKPLHKKTRPRQENIATESDCDVGQDLSQTIPPQPETATSIDDCRPERPVIKALPHGTSLHDGLSGEYHIKGPQGPIRPFEKLLSRHWNPLVKKTLNLIRAARNDCDLVLERSIYQKLLNNPKLKACIGIERIWEEYAWTELHQFDDCFSSRVAPESIRLDAQEWINMARNCYIMPSLAYCLGLDQICVLIEPEAIWRAVLQLVEQPELAEPDVNQEIRFRLRCLFSSMGHTYSLGAMVNPEQSQKLMESARKWYSFKTIDPQYDPHKGLALG